MESNYTKLASLDVSKHIEKKNGLSYLSWAWAVDQLLRHDPMANWSYGEPITLPDGTMMVSCTVTAFGKPMTMHLPVMDYRNKAIPKPNAFDLNTAMMRCLVKAIALHGLGLYIYAGEDLPEEAKSIKCKPTHNPAFQPDEEETAFLQSVVDKVLELGADFEVTLAFLKSQNLDNDETVWIWDKLPSHIRTGITKVKNAQKQKCE